MNPTVSWWLRLLTFLSLPFLVVIGSHELASSAFPGLIKLSHWEWFASFIFIASLGATLHTLSLPKHFREGRVVAGIIFGVFYSLCALVMHVHATCQEIPPYLGGPVANYSTENTEVHVRQHASLNDRGC